MKKDSSLLPDYLTDLAALDQHIRAQFAGLSTSEMGERFAYIAARIIPHTEIGMMFSDPELRDKKSNDGGVDIVAQSRSGNNSLYIQAKLHVDRADAVDSIFSKLSAFTSAKPSGQLDLLSRLTNDDHFMLITLSNLTSSIMSNYQSRNYSSRNVYDNWVASNRVHVVDGQAILTILQTAYRKLSAAPNELTISFETAPISQGGVYLGIVSSQELKRLYQLHGDSLFFENVRDFLGFSEKNRGRTTPNLEILKTVTESPEKLLARNNGLVFGAKKVEPGSNTRQLVLTNGSVVNGCQTTMSIVTASHSLSHVVVKVVETSDSWDIAKAANYQNSVDTIDLELARYLRPQVVKRSAASIGVQIRDEPRSVSQLLDDIYDRKLTFAETRLLYIGIFSKSPNNMFAANYTELNYELIDAVHSSGLTEDEIYGPIFQLQHLSQSYLSQAEQVYSDPSYAHLYSRVFREESLPYRCLVSILALCGAIKSDISERLPTLEDESKRMTSFLVESSDLLQSNSQKFRKYYLAAFNVWMQQIPHEADDAALRRDLFINTKKLRFTELYRKLLMNIDQIDAIS